MIAQLSDSALAASESLLYLYDGTTDSTEKDVVPYLESVASNLLQTSGNWTWDLDRLSIVAASGAIRLIINDEVLPVLQQVIDLLSTEPAIQVDTTVQAPTTTLPSSGF